MPPFVTKNTTVIESFVARTDSTTQMRMIMTSNSYATVGLITAGTAQLTTGGSLANRMLIGHASGTKDIIFVNGGTATTDEIFRISATNTIDIYNARNLTFSTTTGTKFGTSTSQKLGFFNATPIPQPPATSTPQGVADALTNLGLLATSTIYIWNVTTQTGASYNAANNDYVIINATTFTVNLPAISTAGVRVGIKMVAIPASSTAIQVLASSATAVIDGQVSNVLNASTNLYIYNQWDAYTLVSYSDGGVFKWAIES